ncbi:unnamed protein product [Strongylus vulgaris]|uniref:Uncharacterized protein n=1 Tax=Strongylus vulgaris TaxID=40348 RepID=A0A3P7JN55_STRVU|nr:unnamed protein product [Strongylus vulgaris]
MVTPTTVEGVHTLIRTEEIRMDIVIMNVIMGMTSMYIVMMLIIMDIVVITGIPTAIMGTKSESRFVSVNHCLIYNIILTRIWAHLDIWLRSKPNFFDTNREQQVSIMSTDGNTPPVCDKTFFSISKKTSIFAIDLHMSEEIR